MFLTLRYKSPFHKQTNKQTNKNNFWYFSIPLPQNIYGRWFATAGDCHSFSKMEWGFRVFQRNLSQNSIHRYKFRANGGFRLASDVTDPKLTWKRPNKLHSGRYFTRRSHFFFTSIFSQLILLRSKKAAGGLMLLE